MNYLLRDGLTKVTEDISGLFRNESYALAVWLNRDKDPKALEKLVLDEYEFHLVDKGLEFAYRWTSFIFSGWKAEEFNEYSLSVWKRELESEEWASVHPYPEMQSLLNFLHRKNWETYIITASPAGAIKTVAFAFGIKPENVLGMELVIENGQSTSKIIEPYTYGEGKVAMIKSVIGKAPDLAFGDSINDLPMLKFAKQGVLIDKGNTDLANNCRDFNCIIQPVFK